MMHQDAAQSYPAAVRGIFKETPSQKPHFWGRIRLLHVRGHMDE